MARRPRMSRESCLKKEVLAFLYDRQLTQLQTNPHPQQLRRITQLMTMAAQRDSKGCDTKKHKLNFHCHLQRTFRNVNSATICFISVI
jgi:hypothetical protein